MYLRLTSFTASQFGHIFPPSPLLYPFNLLKHIKSLGNLREPTGTAIIHNGENHRITAYHPCSNRFFTIQYRPTPHLHCTVPVRTILYRPTGLRDYCTSSRSQSAPNFIFILSLSSAQAQLRLQRSTCLEAMLRRHQFS